LSWYESVDEHDLFGRARDHKAAGCAFALGALALAGLPPFGTGLGKSLVDDAGHSTTLTVLTIAVSATTGGAVLRVALRVYFGIGPRPATRSAPDLVTGRHEEPDVRSPLARTPAGMAISIALLLAGGLAVGVVPGVAAAVGPGAATFTDQHGYTAVALGQPVSAPPAAPTTEWTSTGVLTGLLAAALAVVVAVAGLYAPRSPAWVRRPAEGLRPVLTGLHRLHSGHIGDYAAWLVFGAAALAGLLAVG
jgi:multicomponent Na+:H+ antiporter subunit D